MTLTCAACGKSFDRLASEVLKPQRANYRTYCSLACQKAFAAAQRRGGVYMILHQPTGQIYIGSSADIRDRWKTHRSHLHVGRHGNAALQALWNADGRQALTWHVLEYVHRTSDLRAAEQWWLDYYRGFAVLLNRHRRT
jgi:hypothetical protein